MHLTNKQVSSTVRVAHWGWAMYCPYCAVDYTPEEPCFCFPPPPMKETSASKPKAKGPWGEAAEGWSSESDLTAECLTEPVPAGACLAKSPSLQAPTAAHNVKRPWGEAAPDWSFDAPVSSRFPDPVRVEDCVPRSRSRKRVAQSNARVVGPWGDAGAFWSLGPDTTSVPIPESLTVRACYCRVLLPLQRTGVIAVRATVPWGEADEAWSLESDVTSEKVTKPP
jgi:hypothetical protein